MHWEVVEIIDYSRRWIAERHVSLNIGSYKQALESFLSATKLFAEVWH